MTAARKTASRQNGSLSLGPTTSNGKAISARNATRHGMTAAAPVVSEVERNGEWEAHRAAVLADTAPEGAIETALAERIAALLWRLNRVVRYETEALSTRQESAEDDLLRVRTDRAKYDATAPAPWRPGHLREFAESARAVARAFEMVETGPAEAAIKPDDAHGLLDTACIAFKPGEDLVWDGEPKTLTTVGVVRAELDRTAKEFDVAPDVLIAKLRDYVRKDLWESEHAEKVSEAELKRMRRDRLIADVATADRVMRYEVHLVRSLHRTLHEFQRIQAMRLGANVALPVAVDMDVATAAPNSAA